MKNTKIFMFFFFLVFAFAFAAPGFFLFSEVNDHFKKEDIKNTGTEITAKITKTTSNTTVNGKSLYSVHYEFVVDGVTYKGQTDDRYYYNELVNKFKNKKILVKYDSNFNSVEADYKFSGGIIVGITSVFIIADLGFWITEIVFIVQFIKGGIISMKGKKYEATFVSIIPGVVLNGTPLYKISYIWKDDEGVTHDGTSATDYTLNEASIFENAKTFNILGWKNNSRIIDKPSKLTKLMVTEPKDVTIDSYYQCEYCGSIFQKSESRCHSCGAPIKKINNKKANN